MRQRLMPYDRVIASDILDKLYALQPLEMTLQGYKDRGVDIEPEDVYSWLRKDEKFHENFCKAVMALTPSLINRQLMVIMNTQLDMNERKFQMKATNDLLKTVATEKMFQRMRSEIIAKPIQVIEGLDMRSRKREYKEVKGVVATSPQDNRLNESTE